MGSLDYSTLGSARVAALMIDDNPNFKVRLSDTLAPDFPERFQITARQGTVFYTPRRSYVSNENNNFGPVGDKADTPMLESDVQSRNYYCERYTAGECYPEGLTGDTVFDHTKETLVPKTRNQVSLMIDSLVAKIIEGNGTDTDRHSRAVSITDLTGVEWDTALGAPLQALKDAVKQVGQGPTTEVVLGDNVADALQGNGEIVQSILGTDTSLAQVTRDQLVAYLLEYLAVGRVTIGMRQFHNGGSNQTLDLQFLMPNAAYVGVIGNITKIPWKPMKGREYMDESKEVEVVAATEWCDVITLDPEMSVSFQNVLQNP